MRNGEAAAHRPICLQAARHQSPVCLASYLCQIYLLLRRGRSLSEEEDEEEDRDRLDRERDLDVDLDLELE